MAGREEDYYSMDPVVPPPLPMEPLMPYRSPAAQDLSAANQDYKLDAIYNNTNVIKGRTDSILMMGMPGGAPMYGDGQAAYTDMRASYGDFPGMLAYGAASGISVVGQGAYTGASRMMADLGGMIRPITYTPPARVYVGYSGRHQQQTGIFNSMGALFDETPRSMSPYMYRMNAAEDIGERLGLSMGGLATSAGSLVVSGVAGKLGGMVGGLAGSIAASLLGYAGASYAADQIYQGVAARRDIQSFLDRTSDLYVTAGSSAADPRKGAGFSRAARRDIANFIREMDIKDPLLGTEDLMNILKSSTELGMFTGVRETGEFKKKFKTIVQNVKEITVALGSTLEEGLKTMKDLKGIGVDQSMAASTVLYAQSLGKASGRTASEMVNLGLQGAEMFRGTGISMQIGFQANLMNVSAVRASRDAQMLSQEAIAQAGGEEALAQRMTANTLGYVQSSVGRGFGGMYFTPGQGFNPSAFMQSLGGMDMSAAAMQAARNLGSPRAIIEYQANQEKFRTEQARMYGNRGLQVGQLSEILMHADWLTKFVPDLSMENATRFVMKQQGMDESTIQANLAMMKDPAKIFEQQQAGAMAAYNQRAADQSINNFFLTRGMHKISDWVKGKADIAAEPISRFVDNFTESVVRVAEESTLGLYRYDVGNLGLKEFNADVRQYLPEDVRSRIRDSEKGFVGGLRRGDTVDITKLEGIITGKILGGSVASDFLDAFRDGDPTGFGINIRATRGEPDSGVVLLRTLGGEVASLPTEAYGKAMRARNLLTLSPEDAAAMDTRGELTEHKKFVRAFFVKSRGADLDNIKTAGDLIRSTYGTDDVSPQQFAALLQETKGTRFEKILEDSRKVMSTFDPLSSALITTQQRELAAKADSLSRSLGFKGITDPGTRALLAGAMIAETDEGRKSLENQAKERAVVTDRSVAMSGAWERDISSRLKVVTPSEKRDAEELILTLGQISAIQTSKGHNLMASQLKSELASGSIKVPDNVSANIIRAADVMSKGREGFEELITSKDYGLIETDLRKTPTGAIVADQLQAFKAYSEKSPELREKMVSSLPEVVRSRFQSTYETEGSSAVLDKIVNEDAQTVAGYRGTSTTGPVSGASTDLSLASKAFEQQTNINWVTYKAFEALARRLGAIQ